ncbi:MAG: glutathione peroxidase [gamma proteobacterium symbiont of Bathyaustriella thionipta]|nr:glutathione peroxidase [gamma proteobacterium symbiont of Bathyaustriella thionipta]MCU7950799.1 glutathione peroxidase [gamma proteobacterium symbiont of Bathyaustriella thionipta]MCU7952348.1 glutathione peroxidase [gamma proteobacterium symbiont of Bathyaustriella thionipta]MCU7957311.1 glutathione peroxidase [gamma proteobacterium symbiont of Bathyaustriella thionipta]
MLDNREGQKVPAVTFKTRQDSEWADMTSSELFDNKKVVVFALPGAFTPTCSSSHLPRYNELYPVFKNNGIDDIYCLSVNDTFVMNAWQDDQNAEKITMLPDGNGEFSKGMGMLVDKQHLGFGDRSWRYAMIVDNGVIEKMFIEPEVDGDPFGVSDADTVLNYINPEAKALPTVTVISRKGCPHCTRAKELLTANGLPYEEVELSHSVTNRSLTALSGAHTTPQVFMDGQLIGGADDLENFFK